MQGFQALWRCDHISQDAIFNRGNDVCRFKFRGRRSGEEDPEIAPPCSVSRSLLRSGSQCEERSNDEGEIHQAIFSNQKAERRHMAEIVLDVRGEVRNGCKPVKVKKT